jgi:hypothetical protein
MKAVEKRTAIQLGRVLEPAIGERLVEIADVTAQRRRVEGQRLLLRDDGVRTQVAAKRVDELRKRMPRAGLVALGPQEPDQLVSRGPRVICGSEIREYAETASLRVHPAQGHPIALEKNGSEGPKPKRHIPCDGVGKAV